MRKTTEKKIVVICATPMGEPPSVVCKRASLSNAMEAYAYLRLMVDEGLLETVEFTNPKTHKASFRYKSTPQARERYAQALVRPTPYCDTPGQRRIRTGPKPRFGFRWLKPDTSFTVPLSDYPGLTLRQLQAKIGSAAGKSAKRFKHTYATKADRDAQAILVTRTG